MPAETHFEPFLHLAGLGDDEALLAWGGFWFRRGDSAYREWRIVDDEELREVAGDRTESIGGRSEPYGRAVVEVERDGELVAREETDEANHLWIRGLEPASEYRYRVLVDGEPWAAGERRDWDLDRRTLAPGRRYDNRFRTFAAGDTSEPVVFALLGDYGIGILQGGEDAERQERVARALERAVDTHDVRLLLTAGDNVYLGEEGTVAGTGNEDDDWYGSFYQPYRYLLNRIPVFPTVGNHDTADTEESDDREQLDDNFFLDLRFRREIEADRASLEPGLFYRFGVGADLEFVCVDTSLASELDGIEHYFDDGEHYRWVRDSLLRSDDPEPVWRIPFSHHPPYCAGPKHPNTQGMVDRLVPLFEQAGVRLVLSGHEHNFQYSVVNDVHYVLSGAGGKLRGEEPTRFEEAHTRAYAVDGHFLLVEASRERLLVHPVRDVRPDGTLEPLELRAPDGAPYPTPIEIRA